jgi:hypothetical protein
MSRSIGETLANNALERLVRPLHVVHAECDPVVVPEIELGEIAMQMLLAAVLIDAGHPALEDAEQALDGVGVDAIADVLADECFTVRCSAKSWSASPYSRLSSVCR